MMAKPRNKTFCNICKVKFEDYLEVNIILSSMENVKNT